MGPVVYLGYSTFDNDLEPLRSEETHTTEFRNSLAAGLAFEYNFKTNFGIRGDVLFDQLKGFQAYYVVMTNKNNEL